MELHISQWNAWVKGIQTKDLLGLWATSHLDLPDECAFPVPEFVPKMQRRRLSPLAKMVLSQVEKLPDFALMQTVFSTRHGDLSKTVELIASVAKNEDLSPTQFALSVHNAVSGQFGIFASNIQSSTLVTAGSDSFHMGLIDALARLKQSTDQDLIYVYADMPLPQPYQSFADEQQIENCVAMTLSKQPTKAGLSFQLTCSEAADDTKQPALPLPQSLQFLKHLLLKQNHFDIVGNNAWNWTHE